MKGSKKVIISLSILSAVLVAVVISMAAVLASFTAVATNQFNISYTAGANVEAEVKAEYQILTGYAAAHSGTGWVNTSDKISTSWQTGSTHTFTVEDTEETISATKTVEVADAFSHKYNILVIRFTIKNNGDGSIKVNGLEDIQTGDSNMVVVSAKTASGTATTIFDSGENLAADGSLEVYVQVRVQTYTTNAHFNRHYTFTLEAL